MLAPPKRRRIVPIGSFSSELEGRRMLIGRIRDLLSRWRDMCMGTWGFGEASALRSAWAPCATLQTGVYFLVARRRAACTSGARSRTDSAEGGMSALLRSSELAKLVNLWQTSAAYNDCVHILVCEKPLVAPNDENVSANLLQGPVVGFKRDLHFHSWRMVFGFIRNEKSEATLGTD